MKTDFELQIPTDLYDKLVIISQQEDLSTFVESLIEQSIKNYNFLFE